MGVTAGRGCGRATDVRRRAGAVEEGSMHTVGRPTTTWTAVRRQSAEERTGSADGSGEEEEEGEAAGMITLRGGRGDF